MVICGMDFCGNETVHAVVETPVGERPSPVGGTPTPVGGWLWGTTKGELIKTEALMVNNCIWVAVAGRRRWWMNE